MKDLLANDDNKPSPFECLESGEILTRKEFGKRMIERNVTYHELAHAQYGGDPEQAGILLSHLGVIQIEF